jgi:hypothetical protein
MIKKVKSEILKELITGKGWIVINNFDLKTPEKTFIETMSEFGEVVNQNNLGDLVSHIKDVGATVEEVLNKGVLQGDNKNQTANRPYQSNVELEFHTDLADLAFLLCIEPAKVGGESKIVNSHEVHSYIKFHHPDDLKELHEPYQVMHQDRAKPDGKNHLINYPVFRDYEGELSSFILRTFTLITHEKMNLKLSEKRKQALNRVDEVAKKLCTTFKMNKGDLLIMNNHRTYHGRSAFKGSERYLLRGWVCPPNNHALHPDYSSLYGNTNKNSLRGGFVKL